MLIRSKSLQIREIASMRTGCSCLIRNVPPPPEVRIMIDSALVTEVLRYLSTSVPTVGRDVPLENANRFELTADGFQIGFPDDRYVELSSPAKYGGTVIFFTGRLVNDLGTPLTSTVQLHGAESLALHRRVVDVLLA